MKFSVALVGACFACNTNHNPMGSDMDLAKDLIRGQLHSAVSDSEATAKQQGLSVGDSAPDVELTLQDGTSVKLSDMRGQRLVLFFYPMDDTPGCRAEARGFRDRHEDFLAAQSTILGVSLQDAVSHRRFIEKEQLPFNLVVDTQAAVSRAFGVPVHGNVAARHTFLLDTEGRIAQIWRNVSPRTHAEEVLATITN